MVGLALDGGVGQHAGGLLEGGGGQEAVGVEGGLGDAQQHGPGRGGGAAFGDGLFVQGLEFEAVHHGAGQQAGAAGVLHPDLLQHLPHHDLDVLVVDVHALQAVDPFNFAQQIHLDAADALDGQQVVRIDGAFGDLVAGFHGLALDDLEGGAVGALVFGQHLAFFLAGAQDLDFALAGLVADLDHAVVLGDDALALGLAGLEQLFHAGQTLGDVAAGHAAGVEGSHGQLGAGLADGLGGDGAHGLAHVHHVAGGQVAAVAFTADAVTAAAGEDAADIDLLDAGGNYPLGHGLVHEGAGFGHHLAGLLVHHVAAEHAALDALGQGFDVGDLLYPDAVGVAAVVLADDDLLGHVHQTAGQVAGVGGTQGGVGQALAGAVGGDEELQNGQAFTEVGLDGQVDDAAGGVGHEAAHAGQLADLLHVAAGAGVGHHIDGVEGIQGAHQFPGHVVGGLLPDLHGLAVAFVFADQALLVEIVDGQDLVLGLGHDDAFGLGHLHVLDAHGDAGPGGVLVADGLDAVQHLGGIGDAQPPHDAVHDEGQFLFAHHDVVEAHLPGHGDVVVEDEPAHGGLDALVAQGLGHAFPPGGVLLEGHFLILGHPHGVPFLGLADLDLGLEVDITGVVGPEGLVEVLEHLAFAPGAGPGHGQVVGAQDHILRGGAHRVPVLGVQDVVGGQHEHAGFGLGFHGQRYVHGHLVAVEVGVEGGADQRMQLDGAALHQHRLKGLDAQTVQGGSAVQQHGMLVDHVLQHVPHLGTHPLHHALGVLDIVSVALADQAFHDEGLEQLQGHFLGQAALMHLQLRAHHDDGTAGIVHALAQQVLTEAALLALEHVGQGFQGPVAGAGDRASAAAVVDEGVHRLLQHALFVADDDVRRAQVQQSLQTVVAVDDPAVEVVQVGGGEAAAVQLHHGAQLRRDDRDHVQNHPLRLVAGIEEAFHHFQPADGAHLALAGHVLQLFPQLFLQSFQVDGLQHLLHGLRAHAGLEGVAPLLPGFAVLALAEQLVLDQIGAFARVQHDIGHEIEHLFQVARAHVQQQAHAGGDALEIPDVGHGSGQLDVAQPFPAHLGPGHLHAAAVADDALVAHALIFAAVAFPVPGGAEDAFAEQAVPFRFQSAVVDGLRLFHFAVGPGFYLFRGSQSDAHTVEITYIQHLFPLLKSPRCPGSCRLRQEPRPAAGRSGPGRSRPDRRRPRCACR